MTLYETIDRVHEIVRVIRSGRIGLAYHKCCALLDALQAAVPRERTGV